MASPTESPPAPAEEKVDSQTGDDNGSKSKKDEEFEAQRAADAASQGLTAEDAVPERRPIASQQPYRDTTGLTASLEDSDLPEFNTEPMGREAYERAESDGQAKKADKASRSEGIMVGNVVRVTKGPHEGRIVAVTRVITHENWEDTALKAAGSPEQLYLNPVDIEGSAKGDERDGEVLILNVEEAGLEKLNDATFHRRRTR